MVRYDRCALLFDNMNREDKILADWQQIARENARHVCGQTIRGVLAYDIEVTPQEYMDAWRQTPDKPDKKLRVVLQDGELGPFVYPRWHNSIDGKQILMLRTAFGVVLVCDNRWITP